MIYTFWKFIKCTHSVKDMFVIDEIRSLKQLLSTKVIDSFSWVPTTEKLADCLTKQMKEPPSFRDIFLWNKFCYDKKEYNKVIAMDQEIRMINRQD